MTGIAGTSTLPRVTLAGTEYALIRYPGLPGYTTIRLSNLRLVRRPKRVDPAIRRAAEDLAASAGLSREQANQVINSVLGDTDHPTNVGD